MEDLIGSLKLSMGWTMNWKGIFQNQPVLPSAGGGQPSGPERSERSQRSSGPADDDEFLPNFEQKWGVNNGYNSIIWGYNMGHIYIYILMVEPFNVNCSFTIDLLLITWGPPNSANSCNNWFNIILVIFPSCTMRRWTWSHWNPLPRASRTVEVQLRANDTNQFWSNFRCWLKVLFGES